MITVVLICFALALALSLAATPVARWVGRKAGAMDNPDARKVHKVPIPRSGGAAIFYAFIVTLVLAEIVGKTGLKLFLGDIKTLGFFAGAIIVFTIGFIDDLHRLGPRIKFLAQALGVTVAFVFGLRITIIPWTEWHIHSVWISYGLTLFWFALLINAINLIDGLDGLAAGITFLACTILAILLVLQGQYVGAVYFATLAGSILGFLRYNFNSASIFMGDGGSYFIGYAIAGLSILASTKVQTGAVMLILALAMGVPLFDTALSPIRRFVVGKKPFQPDQGHIHHRLVSIGLSKRRVVLVLYGISAILCLCSIFLVNAQNRSIGLFLVLLGIVAFVASRRFGYFRYLTPDKIGHWLRNIMDVTGLSPHRRQFFGLQIEISKAHTRNEMWARVCKALDYLGFNRADFILSSAKGINGNGNGNGNHVYYGDERRSIRPTADANIAGDIWQVSSHANGHTEFHWVKGHYRRREDMQKEQILKVEIPFSVKSSSLSGSLFVVKDAHNGDIHNVTLKRVWQLRETIAKTIEWVDQEAAIAKRTPGIYTDEKYHLSVSEADSVTANTD
jgi:UDP-GlcNAc:undecaprenyl-phosphate/decaprenyl-phosphate GlcNAc-1-phosphate transferase